MTDTWLALKLRVHLRLNPDNNFIRHIWFFHISWFVLCSYNVCPATDLKNCISPVWTLPPCCCYFTGGNGCHSQWLRNFVYWCWLGPNRRLRFVTYYKHHYYLQTIPYISRNYIKVTQQNKRLSKFVSHAPNIGNMGRLSRILYQDIMKTKELALHAARLCRNNKTPVTSVEWDVKLLCTPMYDSDCSAITWELH